MCCFFFLASLPSLVFHSTVDRAIFCDGGLRALDQCCTLDEMMKQKGRKGVVATTHRTRVLCTILLRLTE